MMLLILMIMMPLLLLLLMLMLILLLPLLLMLLLLLSLLPIHLFLPSRMKNAAAHIAPVDLATAFHGGLVLLAVAADRF